MSEYPQPEQTGEAYKPPVINTKQPEPLVVRAAEDVVRAKIGLLQLDALEVSMAFTSAQISNSAGLRREHLVRAAGSLERLTNRLRELLK